MIFFFFFFHLNKLIIQTDKIYDNKRMGLFGKLLRLFIIFKGIQFILVYFTPCQFDTSSQIIINNLKNSSPYNPIITTILNKLIVWDSVYFNDLYINPIRFEHQFVFCPGWIKFIKILIKGDNYYFFQISSILISNIFHFISVIILYYLTNEIINGNELINYYSSLFFIISPAGIFLTTNYSENFNNLLTLLTLFIYFKAINFNDVNQFSNKSINNKFMYVLSGIICSISFTVRANSLFLGILYLLDLYHFLQNMKRNKKDSITQIIYSLITGSLLFFTFLGTNIYHYITFCPSRGEWCNNIFPSLFKFAQDHYWNVGFLKYWTMNNIPNFILVAPVLSFNIYAINYMINYLPKYRKLLPIIIINSLTLIGGVFFWNIQILNRITSFSPLLYWTLADNQQDGKYWVRYVIYYSILWSCIQAVLFAGFLPPA